MSGDSNWLSDFFSASIEAVGSAAESIKNIFDYIPRVYANCGRWQNGATDFLVVSESEIVLATWGNYLSEFGGRSIAHQGTKDEVREREADRIARSQFQKASQIEGLCKGNKTVLKFFKDAPVGKAFPVEVTSFRFDEESENFYFTEKGKVIVIVPDCHITYFKGWIIDAFAKPKVLQEQKLNGKFAITIHDQPSETINGYAIERESLETDFADFLTFAHSKTGKSDVIQVGDLYDHWHVQWIYELAYDIYENECNTSHLIFRKLRFPVELLKKPWNHSTPHRTYDSWWELFPSYMGVAPASVKSKWNTLSPLDVIAIVLWGLEFKLPYYATPLENDDWKVLTERLDVSFDGLVGEVVQAFSTLPTWAKSRISNTDTAFWNAVDKLKKSVCGNKDGSFDDSSIDFLEPLSVEERIKKRYPILANNFKNLDDSNYIRGNHDCLQPNLYLKDKFTNPNATTKSLQKEWTGKLGFDGLEGLKDSQVDLTNTAITKICGANGRICIEHGDAWDRQNNGINYFRFEVGNPWTDSDVRFSEWVDLTIMLTKLLLVITNPIDTLKGITEGKFVGGVLEDGGYHMPRTKKAGGILNSYFVQQLTNPGSGAHKGAQVIGDKGLEPAAEFRTKMIFASEEAQAKEVWLVIMGHTHLPKIESSKDFIHF